MNRLALAKTLVQGTVTLQGKSFTFSASGSGTGTADRVSDAKKLAITVANSAAATVARASIDAILLNNSAILSDLEITSLISNNLSTTVVVFRPLALSKIATTTNGINYYLKPNVTIEKDQRVIVPTGHTLSNTAETPLTLMGYLELGDAPQTSVDSAILKDTSADCSSLYMNSLVYGCTSRGATNGIMVINTGCYTTPTGFSNNYGNIYNYASVTVSTGTTLYNECNGSGFTNFCGATFELDGAIINSGPKSFSSVPTSGSGTCTASGSDSVCNQPCVAN